ncbi:16S rRNA m(3)U-1498 methyltransferase [Magnetococcus marinus MC-1]|uniref:Ribosomal RNA small subunit methyltransferase E n=1 Tax=Magnetococcus marinus (strain ATCC BAA-1437 / JCM 17883 / MC-1) TaxID=156889 RepID=A0L472_MAGMM|nr:16S rRNA (uracil(1498)-N(3))-methyltransferase [Magnetococcus marinus]ABK42765.1 16S rRNA m(3)U-1498 methyltransferase [Magnetococcus marinus MC-1]
MSTTPRLYTPQPLCAGQPVTLDREAQRYLLKVLRLGEGDALYLFNGEGGAWSAHITQTSGPLQVTPQQFEPEPMAPLNLTLVQGLSRSGPMELVIQKGVELGLQQLIPLQSARSVARAKGEHKLERWQRIAIEAAEQCRRSRLLQFQPVCDWSQLAGSLPEQGPRILFWEDHRHHTPSLRQWAATLEQAPTQITLLIGPEGGLSAEEVTHATTNLGFQTCSLGPRVLRTETAALAAITALQALLGDMA